jgi:hypothetical protein
MFSIGCPPFQNVGAFMRLLIPTMAFAAVAWSSQAEDVIRKIAELEPVTPAIKRLKPDFETGGFRVDMPASKIVERLTANGFTSTRRLWSKNGAGVDGRYFTTDKYDVEIAAFKESEEKSSKETLLLKFLPGQGGLSFISRRVEFQYRVWQPQLKRTEVEAALTAKFGKPVAIVEKAADKAAKSPNSHVLGLYCFGTEGTATIAPGECDVEKARTDGYSFDIEVDESGDVVAFEVAYDASSYAKSYKDALYDKMKALLQNDSNLGVSSPPPLEP